MVDLMDKNQLGLFDNVRASMQKKVDLTGHDYPMKSCVLMRVFHCSLELRSNWPGLSNEELRINAHDSLQSRGRSNWPGSSE